VKELLLLLLSRRRFKTSQLIARKEREEFLAAAYYRLNMGEMEDIHHTKSWCFFPYIPHDLVNMLASVALVLSTRELIFVLLAE